MSSVLSNIVVTVNGETIGYVPNSLKGMDGDGETKNLAVTSGGNTDVVFSIDASTKLGTPGFALYTTPENTERVREWKNNGQNNVVVYSNDVGNATFSRSFQKAVLITNVDYQYADEGQFDVEFNTLPAIG